MKIQLPQPHAGQAQLMREAQRFNVVECGRRFGKTVTGEILACETVVEGHPAAWFAPTYKYLLEPWRDIKRMLEPITTRADMTERRIECVNGGSLDFWTMEDEDAGRGRKYKRAVNDEAGLVKGLLSRWTQAIRPTLMDLQGDAWFLGTPKGHGDFHRLFTKGETGEPGWKSWRMGTRINPVINKQEIEDARKDMPEAAYLQEIEGIPAEDGGNPFGAKHIAACIRPTSGKPVKAWGIDLAKSDDWTVVLGLDEDGNVSAFDPNYHRWQSPWRETITRIKQIIGQTPALIDSTGVGDPIVEELANAFPNVTGYKFTSSKTAGKQQLMLELAVSIQSGDIGYPDGVIVRELEMFQYEYGEGGRVYYSAPEGLKDDCVCALALARKCLREGAKRLPVSVSFIDPSPAHDEALWEDVGWQ